jgi:hypothetical protein
MIALAILGAGVDALPAAVLAEIGREGCQDNATDDADDVVDVSWLESRFDGCSVRRHLGQPLTGSTFEIVKPAQCVSPQTSANSSVHRANGPPLPTRLCRLTC